MTTGIRQPGEFCWVNILTPEPARACEFFNQVLGWECSETPLGYSLKVGGRHFGALFDVAGPNAPPGTKPQLGVMVRVKSADAVCEKVISLGGSARAPFDIMDRGRMSVCHDPNGAQFDLWQPIKMDGMDVDSSLPGAPSWFETLTTDVDRATTFYSALFGWVPEVMSMPPGVQYTRFTRGDTQVAGMMQITPDMGAMPSHWGVYFTVTDVDATAQRAAGLGATLMIPPRDIERVGRFCGLVSPGGVTFYAITYVR